MEALQQILEGKMPSWCKRIVKQTGRGINRFSMISENDTVLLGVSGGKDSLALAFTLSIRRRWLPISYVLHACVINWKEYPLSEETKKQLARFFQLLDIDFEFIDARMFSTGFKDRFDCYLCSRNRKRILFTKAEEIGTKKIALGHHLDDIVETTLMNLFFRGSFSTMMPVQKFFDGKIFLMRPMCEVEEKDIRKLASRLEFPVYETPCPYKHTNIRVHMKPLLRQLKQLDKQVKEHIYNAHFTVQKEYSDFSHLRKNM